jgi:hypothetical protein
LITTHGRNILFFKGKQLIKGHDGVALYRAKEENSYPFKTKMYRYILLKNIVLLRDAWNAI